MLGYLLLTIALVLFFSNKYRFLSFFIYLCFLFDGFCVLKDSVLGCKNVDMALIYTACLLPILFIQNKIRFPKGWMKLWFTAFILFFISCIFYSIIHYGFSLYQAIQGGRYFILILSLLIFLQIRPPEIQKVFTLLMIVTLATSLLYIAQIIVGRPLMPYVVEPRIDKATGLVRMYNYPPLLSLFLCISFIVPKYFGKFRYVCQIVFLVTLLLTLGRNNILSTLMILILAHILQGKGGKLAKTIIIGCIIILPFLDTITARFEKEGETDEDIETILAQGYTSDYEGEGGTLTYRFAWVYERAYYLNTRPLGEKVFGLGLISDSQPIVHKMYNFSTGIWREELNDRTQLTTSDISYGNLLSRLGYAGMVIYILFSISLSVFFFRRRKENAWITICSAQTIIIYIAGFTGSAFSNPATFAIYFMAIAYCINKNKYALIKEHNTRYIFLPEKS